MILLPSSIIPMIYGTCSISFFIFLFIFYLFCYFYLFIRTNNTILSFQQRLFRIGT